MKLILLLSLAPMLGRADLMNTQKAALEVAGIEVACPPGKLDDADCRVVVRASGGGEIPATVLVMRDLDFDEIGRFPLAPLEGDAEPQVIDFQVRRSLIPVSYLLAGEHVVPLRLFFDGAGRFIDKPEPSDGAPTSQFADLGWGRGSKFFESFQDGDSMPRQSVEALLRRAGLKPPEGTVVFYGLPGGGNCIRSTTEFIEKLETEFQRRGIDFQAGERSGNR